ncbi:WcaI family glycosyltransferase [Sphingobacterium pedocola]|uniref:Colanic acid biosynthesis glycosyltransferase WcaI n=1 Tax=Sphingobacterium pedocola TaxID=2082722 RepID=A0ABR9T1X6_9SPHI|nr:WcaI family glycosyltransferase [Sphingobacterium pedocola]MBE8719333.1 colanic acid biosynthesis glycosyltransferase WcaI [Sphingobacterium pedocola]
MRILIHGINYAPELTGIGKYTGEMAIWLAAQGRDVHVLTALPYYPEWEIHSAYKNKSWFTETLNGVKVHRVPLYVPKEVTSLKRILHEFSFLAATIPFWIKAIFSKKYDVVFCIAPPFHLSLFPWLYKSTRGGVWINHIQDLQVDAAKDLGMIKNKTFLDIMFGLERFFLNRGLRVSTISEGMQHKILSKGIASTKIMFFPNWVDSNVIFPLPKEKSLRQEMGFNLADKIVLYSGNLGEKQGLDAILRAAAAFKADSSVKFVICGSGGGKDKLIRLAEESLLSNVFFFPLQPYEKLSALLAMADLHLVLQKSSAADLVMPSKLTGILAAGGCALVTATEGTTLYDVVYKFQMGILVQPENEEDLLRGIRLGLFGDTSAYRQNARNYAEQYLEKEQILRKFEADLNDLMVLPKA